MSFRENLRRGRSHLLLVVVMIVTAGFVVATEDDNLTRETGKAPPKRALAIPSLPASDAILAEGTGAIDLPDGNVGRAVVQIGAYDTLRDARVASAAFLKTRSDIAGAASTRIERRKGKSTVFRLVLVLKEGASGEEVCAALQESGTDCFVRSR